MIIRVIHRVLSSKNKYQGDIGREEPIYIRTPNYKLLKIIFRCFLRISRTKTPHKYQ